MRGVRVHSVKEKQNTAHLWRSSLLQAQPSAHQAALFDSDLSRRSSSEQRMRNRGHEAIEHARELALLAGTESDQGKKRVPNLRRVRRRSHEYDIVLT